MRTTNATILKMGKSIGAAMWVSWFMFLGPVGFLLLLGVSYAMFMQNLAFAVICGSFIVLPFALTLVWAPLGWFAALHEQRLPLSKKKLAELALVGT
jgi:hypothetical protein